MSKRWWAPGERQCIIDSIVHKSHDIASHHGQSPRQSKRPDGSHVPTFGLDVQQFGIEPLER
jgi:hypothetical protein